MSNNETLPQEPDELNSVKVLIKEFIERIQNIDNEIDLLKIDRKELIEEFKSKIDVKILKAALRVIKIQNSIQHRDTYDVYLEVLQQVQ